jgi:hypothetical protein
MINSIDFLRIIPIEKPLKMVLTRLGYRSSKTILTAQQRQSLYATIEEGFSLCEPQGCWRCVAIKEKKEEMIILENGPVLKSKSIVSLLRDSSAVAFMASTIGPAIVEATSQAVERGEGAIAVIYDAVGGQSADAAMNWINEYVRGQLSRRAERLTVHRFLSGFGDFGLENQKEIYSLLELDRLGLNLTSRYMLAPEKSVTAVAGIEKA